MKPRPRFDESVPTRRASARDVAQLAGVSTATVSRALNLPEQVDPRTRHRVEEAIAKLRYLPHGAARSLRSHRSKMVGAVVPSFDYALYARTTSALQQRLGEAGYSVVLAEQHYDLAAELDITGKLVQHGVDAFMFVGVDHDPALFSMLEDYGRPYVLTWGVDSARRHPSIGFDNREATRRMARHLLSLGHRRFGLISAPLPGNDRARERCAGLRMTLAEAGIDLPAECELHGPISLDWARSAMARLLALPSSKRPTAVCGTNDIFAVGAMLACRDAGVSIPEEMSITGVDSTDLGATQSPALTSIRTPIVEIGTAAADQLIARLHGKPHEPFQTLDFELLVRGSTSVPRE